MICLKRILVRVLKYIIIYIIIPVEFMVSKGYVESIPRVVYGRLSVTNELEFKREESEPTNRPKPI